MQVHSALGMRFAVPLPQPLTKAVQHSLQHGVDHLAVVPSRRSGGIHSHNVLLRVGRISQCLPRRRKGRQTFLGATSCKCAKSSSASLTNARHGPRTREPALHTHARHAPLWRSIGIFSQANTSHTTILPCDRTAQHSSANF